MIEMNRWRTAVAILAVGVTGVFAAGCGGDDNSGDVDKVIDNAQDNINQQLDEAQKQIDEAQKNGDIPSDQEIQDKVDEAQKQIDEGQANGDIPSDDEIQNQVDQAQEDAQKQIDEALKQAGQ